MEVKVERLGTTAIFTPEGRIDSAGLIQLDAALKEQLAPEDREVLLDMAGVQYISSAGIRVLFALEKKLRERGGHLHLCAVRPEVQKVLGITGFDRVFSVSPTRDEAVRRCRLGESTAAVSADVAGAETTHTRLSAETLSDHEAVLMITGSGENVCAGVPDADNLIPRVFTPGEYSTGIGAPGDSAAESFSELGLLMTTGGGIFWKPFKSQNPPDFLIPRPDAPRILLNTAFSAAMDGKFHEILVAEPVSPDGVRLGDLLKDVARHAKAARSRCPPVISIVMYAGTGRPAITPAPESGEEASSLPPDKTLLAIGTCIDTAADLSAYDPDMIREILCQKAPGCRDGDLFLYLSGLVFDAPPAFTTRDVTRLVSETAAKKTCTDLVRLGSGTMLSRAVLGVTYISGIEPADRMQVRILGKSPGWNKTYETIVHWMHPGCRELELTPLTGGFSGTLVFRVSARDSRGSLMMPLVMKLGQWPVIEAEIRGYTDHVKRYIQNNATQIIETEWIGEYGGILYNFVGIRGTESRIFSLEDFYLSHPADEILPVFDTLFTVVLKGWYGEPKKKDIALYREYNRFWNYDGIRAYAASHFGATPEMEEIELPFGLGKSTNPVWFVEKVMPARLSSVFMVHESSVHGDLNMKNVLMDETFNLWLIDFAETRYSHILRDIVKLEAVMKGEMIPVNSRETLEQLVRLDLPFLSARTLSDIPELPGTITDPAMEKAFRVVQKLREYADIITPGDNDIMPYYIGLLMYTLNLLSYVSVNDFQKEYGWIASSRICRRLMENGA